MLSYVKEYLLVMNILCWKLCLTWSLYSWGWRDDSMLKSTAIAEHASTWQLITFSISYLQGHCTHVVYAHTCRQILKHIIYLKYTSGDGIGGVGSGVCVFAQRYVPIYYSLYYSPQLYRRKFKTSIIIWALQIQELIFRCTGVIGNETHNLKITCFRKELSSSKTHVSITIINTTTKSYY